MAPVDSKDLYPPQYNQLVQGSELMLDWLQESRRYLRIILNSISLFCALIVILIMVSMILYNRKLMQRLSLRMTLAIAIVDTTNHVAGFLYSQVDNTDGNLCVFSAWLVVWLPVLYCFLNAMIALNLQLVFLHDFNPSHTPNRKKWGGAVASPSSSSPFHLPSKGNRLNLSLVNWYELMYWFLAIGGSLLVTLPPLAFEVYGYDSGSEACFYRDNTSNRGKLMEWVTFLGWITLCCLYCTVISVLVILKLNKHSKTLVQSTSNGTSHRVEGSIVQANKNLSKLVRRIAIYPTIPTLTQLGVVVSEIYFHLTNRYSPILDLWATCGVASVGILNLFALMVDPAIHHALTIIGTDLLNLYGYLAYLKLYQPNLRNSLDEREYQNWIQFQPNPALPLPIASSLPTDLNLTQNHSNNSTLVEKPSLIGLSFQQQVGVWFCCTFLHHKIDPNNPPQPYCIEDKETELNLPKSTEEGSGKHLPLQNSKSNVPLQQLNSFSPKLQEPFDQEMVYFNKFKAQPKIKITSKSKPNFNPTIPSPSNPSQVHANFNPSEPFDEVQFVDHMFQQLQKNNKLMHDEVELILAKDGTILKQLKNGKLDSSLPSNNPYFEIDQSYGPHLEITRKL